jgi:tyrosyl-tRNA synthetase
MDIEKEVERQFKLLMRGVEDLISEEEFKKKLKNSITNNKPLVVKLGVDPTGSDLHIGHAVQLRKLKMFQELGHKVKFLIGTFTAKIGDPTGKSETRKMLTDEDIAVNIKGWLEQAKLILDLDKIEVVYNGDWLSKLTLEDTLNLLSQFTVAQMVQREDFAKRLDAGKPVSLVEFMYPILQGYDSVVIEADIELGATEQKFNILRGRDLQKNKGQEQQVCMMTPILVGLDGVEKMSKSLGNYIGITEAPNDIFGKTMSISDELMWNYYELATEVPVEEITKIREGVTDGSYHPMEAKKRLGTEIVALYYGEEEGKKAREYFDTIFSKREISADIKEVIVGKEEMGILEILCQLIAVCKSNGEARRLISGNGVKINGETVTDANLIVKIEDGMILKAGKKTIVKLMK